MLTIKELLSIAAADFTFNSFIYIIFALPAFLLFWVFGKNFFKARRIQAKKRATKKNIRRELFFSMTTLMIFCIIDVGIYVAAENGVTKIYIDSTGYPWWYWGVSVGVMLIFHDAYFYWAHRLMHHPVLYKHVHRIHHESVDPSPFTAFAFHPLEALVEAGFYVIFIFIIPIHLGAIILWQIIQQGLNVIGHMGYEVYPRGFTKNWFFSWKTASTHHNMHHAKFEGNYGLYFTWWDKWFGTEFEDYHETYDAVHDRIDHAKQITEADLVNNNNSNNKGHEIVK
jgi:sterol desaturase/sphingolipid hydroxylase (fatty acid hydroxylase superfamily)